GMTSMAAPRLRLPGRRAARPGRPRREAVRAGLDEPAQRPGEVPGGARAGDLELLVPGDERACRRGIHREAHLPAHVVLLSRRRRYQIVQSRATRPGWGMSSITMVKLAAWRQDEYRPSRSGARSHRGGIMAGKFVLKKG